jgi:predicted transcriptional regulator
LFARGKTSIHKQQAEQLKPEGKTQLAIADELEVSQQSVGRDLLRNTDRSPKVSKPRNRIRLEINSGTKMEVAASKIVEKFGSVIVGSWLIFYYQ